jgi:hypothetical protein
MEIKTPTKSEGVSMESVEGLLAYMSSTTK